MSIVNILNIQVLDNPTHFSNPFQFEITFECTDSLEEDLEWKIIYVGSAEDKQYDQVLDCIMVGPVPVGVNKFVFQADAPNTSLIPRNDLDGVTVALLTCSYRDCEFVRVGYYVNNEYIDPLTGLVIEDSTVAETGDSCALDGVMEGDGAFGLNDVNGSNGSNVAGVPIQGRQHQQHQEQQEKATPEKKFENLMRNILADRPRVTRFPIKWDCLLDETVTSTELINEVANSDEVMTDFAAIGVSINDGGDDVVGFDEDDYEFEDDDEDEDDEDDDEEDDEEEEYDEEVDEDDEEDLQAKMKEEFSPSSSSSLTKTTLTATTIRSPSFAHQPIEESTTSIKEPISGGGAIDDAAETPTKMTMMMDC